MNNNTINASNKNKENDEKKKKKSIPININLNHGQFLFKSNINKIASSYISIGRKIQTRKNKNLSRIQVSTNSVINNYTKQATTSSYVLNNSKNCGNKSDFGYINGNKNIYNNRIQKEVVNKIGKNKFKFTKRIIHSKDRKQLSTSSNSNISNDLFANGYKTSINNLNNIKIKNRIINLSATKDNNSKNQENYSSRTKNLDSRNKTKKITMKSKLQQFRCKKNISTSYADSYTTKRQLRDKFNQNINNCLRKDLFSKIEKIYGKNYSIIHMNQNLYKIRHLRHNTANFAQNEIMNIFHKRTLSNKFINNNTNKISGNTINNISNININNNIYINNDKNINININKLQNSLNKNIEISSKMPNCFHKINYKFKSKERIKKSAKINNNDIRIYIKENKLKLSDNKLNLNLQNKFLSNNISNFKIIPGIKKITIKGNDNKISDKNIIDVYNQIPIPNKKLKNIEIPSQRTVKLNYIKISQNTKKKKNNKGTISRKSSSKKGKSEGNNNQFSLSQTKSKSLIKKNEDDSILKTNDIKRNINFGEDNKKIDEIKNMDRENEINNNLFDINYITNLNNNISENILNHIKKEELTKYVGKTDSNYSIDNNLDIIDINNKIYVNKKDSKNIYQKEKINTNYSGEKEYQRKTEEVSKSEKMEETKEKLKDNNIVNDLFSEENLEELPEDYDEDFNDLYSIINKINFGRVLVGVEGFFTLEGKSYKKYKDKFDKYYDKLYLKKRNINYNSNVKKKNVMEFANMASNAKTNYSSSKKGIVNNI